jgi:DNA-binding response OmpR family regulator
MPNSVLVFEESAVIRELCVDVLVASGFIVDTTDDTATAINAIVHSDYSFVIIGSAGNAEAVNMPVCIRAAEEACGKYTPIIGMCCASTDMDDYVQMPMSMKTLKETVERWFHYSVGRTPMSGAA